MDLGETGCEAENWVELTQDRAFVNISESSGIITSLLSTIQGSSCTMKLISYYCLKV
jgi:hypothetical protein